ncbi:MAG: hypothetical protein LBP62_05665 [Clostridiales bacterium]|jgi:hypothetical protein|nr:hypothetical protein [Clostridiales bacterium]
MKGKIFKNNFGKLTVRGEDGKFYMIGQSLGIRQEGESVEFEPTEKEYNGKQQFWANAPKKKDNDNNHVNNNASPDNDPLSRIIKGLSLLLLEQKGTNKLLAELLQKCATAFPSSAAPKQATPTDNTSLF